MRVVVTPRDHMTAHEPTTAYGINGKTVQGSWEQRSSFLLLCRVTWMWRSHCSPHEGKSPSGGVGGVGVMRGVLLWPFKNPCFKDKKNSGDEVLTESQGGWSYLKSDWEGKTVPNASACSAGEHRFFWSSSWPSVLKARTFELKSKTCKLLENSQVDDQHLVWSGRLSPSSTSSRWRFEPRFEPKLFPQADTWALHLGIKGPVGLHCVQQPSTFICSPERGLAGLCPLADSCSCNLSSPGQNQVVEIRSWD